MSIRLSCPSCNTAFALDAVPAHRRATCPRCGDVFPIHGYTEEAGDGPPVPVTDAGARTPHASRTRGEGRRMLGVLAAAAFLILITGLPPFLVFLKRPRDKAPETPVPLAATAAIPPPQLAGLGYLRADCNVAFAVQPGPLLHFADRTQQAPREVLARAGLPDAARNLLDQFGVPLAQIDHIAGGIDLGEGENALRLALVLVLKHPPANEDDFLKALQARTLPGKKGRYDAALGRFGLVLARVSPTVWVFGLDETDLEAVDRGGYGPGGTQLRGGVKPVLATVPPEAAVWVAADDDRDWTQKPIAKFVGGSPDGEKWLAAAKDGRGGMLAVSLGDRPRVKVHIRTATDATGARVRGYFTARAAETESATSGGSGASAHFDAPFDANSGALLRRFLTDAGR